MLGLDAQLRAAAAGIRGRIEQRTDPAAAQDRAEQAGDRHRPAADAIGDRAPTGEAGRRARRRRQARRSRHRHEWRRARERDRPERAGLGHRPRRDRAFDPGFDQRIRTAAARQESGERSQPSDRFDHAADRYRISHESRPKFDVAGAYFRRRIRRRAAIRRFAAADPFTSCEPRRRRRDARAPAATEFRRRRGAAALAFFFARRRRCVVRPPLRPVAFANNCWVAAVCCANPAKPPGGTISDISESPDAARVVRRRARRGGGAHPSRFRQKQASMIRFARLRVGLSSCRAALSAWPMRRVSTNSRESRPARLATRSSSALSSPRQRRDTKKKQPEHKQSVRSLSTRPPQTEQALLIT